MGYPRLSAADVTNLAVERADTPMHVGALAILDGATLLGPDGRLRLAGLRAEIAGRLGGAPVLRQVVRRPGPLAGRPLWIDDPDFRIDRHVGQVELAAPGDRDALLRLAEELMAPRLDRAHPLWRLWFITGRPDDEVAVLIVLHHAVADGTAALRLLTVLLDPAVPGGPPTPGGVVAPTGDWFAAPAPGWFALVLDNARTRSAHPFRPPSRARWRAGWQGLAQARKAPRTSLTGPIGPRRRLGVVRIDIAAARRVAHAEGGHVNDVILSLATAGLGALLRARGEQTDGVALHAAVAVSLRHPGRPTAPGNEAGIIVVKLPMDEADPPDRLHRVGAATARAKEGQSAGLEPGLLVWLARSGLLRLFTRHQRLTNVVESDVAGPAEPIRLLDAPVRELIPIGALAGNLAVSFLALSYAGQLTIAVRVDADRYPDLPVLLAAMTREWSALDAGRG